MDLSTDEIEMLKFFCFRLLKNSNSTIPNLRFIFTDSDYKKIMNYLENLKSQKKAFSIDIKTNFSDRHVLFYDIENIIQLIKDTQNEFNKNRNEDTIYIEIPDCKEFIKLLNEIMINFDNFSKYNNFTASYLLYSIWLRMGPNDISNVNIFLKRQLAFIKNDYILPMHETLLEEKKDLYISYLNHGNENYFETNRHLEIFIKRKKDNTVEPFGDTENNYIYYALPSIHYALIKENSEPTCYIYGIQYLKNVKKDEEINIEIHEEKRRLRNKSVSPDFIIALKIFIDLLKKEDITTIKVPLLQIFNYDFHKQLGEKYHKRIASYTPERIKDIEYMNASDFAIREYERIKKEYERYYNKEDLISANKTERLINTFYLVNEAYNNLDIITEPFSESDNLICKIKTEKKKTNNFNV